MKSNDIAIFYKATYSWFLDNIVQKTTTVCRTGQLACAWPDRYATWSNQFDESDKDCPKAKKVSQCIQIEISNYTYFSYSKPDKIMVGQGCFFLFMYSQVKES